MFPTTKLAPNVGRCVARQAIKSITSGHYKWSCGVTHKRPIDPTPWGRLWNWTLCAVWKKFLKRGEWCNGTCTITCGNPKKMMLCRIPRMQGIHLIKRKRTTNTKTRYLKSIQERPTQAVVEWSWHVISIAACNIIVTSPDLFDHKTIISIILLQNVESFVPEFIEILPEFSTNQNFWGCTCIPCTPASYTTALVYRPRGCQVGRQRPLTVCAISRLD